MTNFIHAHAIEIIIVWFLFSSLVSGLPEPKDDAPYWYKILYGCCHALAANLAKVADVLKQSGIFNGLFTKKV